MARNSRDKQKDDSNTTSPVGVKVTTASSSSDVEEEADHHHADSSNSNVQNGIVADPDDGNRNSRADGDSDGVESSTTTTSIAPMSTDAVGEGASGGASNPTTTVVTTPQQEQPQEAEQPPIIKLHKSSRLKGYITIALASFINYDSATKSNSTKSGVGGSIPSLPDQRRYAISVAIVSFLISIILIFIHLDRVSPFRKLWYAAFKSGSKVEAIIDSFLVIWWSIAVGFHTSVDGIAGDSKGQYSLYYSSWACCLTSYWVLERWWVAAGWVSFSCLFCYCIGSPHNTYFIFLILNLSFFV